MLTGIVIRTLLARRPAAAFQLTTARITAATRTSLSVRPWWSAAARSRAVNGASNWSDAYGGATVAAAGRDRDDPARGRQDRGVGMNLAKSRGEVPDPDASTGAANAGATRPERPALKGRGSRPA